MTATTIEPGADLSGKNRVGDRIFRWATYGAGVFVLLVLGAIALTMTSKAWPAFDEMGFDFFTSKRWAPSEGIFGARALIFGTLYTALIALVLAVPVSLGIALFTTQVAPLRLRRWIVSIVDLLAVIPSVVFGLWGILFLAPKLPGFFDSLHDIFGPVPVLGWIFGTSSAGRSFLTAGVILAIMITPIITSLAREVIDTTPPSDREAAYGLRATRWGDDPGRGAAPLKRGSGGCRDARPPTPDGGEHRPLHGPSARESHPKGSGSRRANPCPVSSPTKWSKAKSPVRAPPNPLGVPRSCGPLGKSRGNRGRATL